MGLIGNLQDKLSGHKDPAVNASYNNQGVNSSHQTHDTTTGGLTGSSHPTHGTTTTSNNPLSSNAPHGSSGITGGSHPLVSGGNNTHNTPGYGSGEGSHLTGSTGQHSNTGLTGTHQSGTGLTGTSHSGSGLTGTSHTGGLTDSSRTGHGIGSSTHGGHSQDVNFVPASHPSANNPSAIPTAGGQKVGGVGDSHAGVHQTMGDKAKNTLPGQHGNAHDAYGNPINPSSTGPHTTSTHSSHPTGSHTTGHNTHTGSGFSSSAQPLSHDSQFNDRHSGPGVGTGAVAGAGLAGASHHNTHNTHNVGEDNRGMMDKAKDALSSKRSSKPDDPVTGTNYDQKDRHEYTSGTHGSGLTGSSHNTGLTGSNTHSTHNTGLTGSNTHSTHNTGVTGSSTHNTHGSGVTGSNTHHSGVVGEDNRGMMDKAKDALSSKRSNQPDDPITGTNYDQKDRHEYTSGTHGSGLTGSSHNTSHQAGVAGISSGLGQTHLGSNTHSNTHSSGVTGHNSSHIGRSAEWKEGYEAGLREGRLSSSGSHSTSTTSGVHSGSHSGPYSSTTSTGYTGSTKPTMGEKMNPKIDADRDGKAGFMD